MSENSSYEIRIVFDNKCYRSGFLPGFGFSALIFNKMSNKFLLFDTGGNGNILIHNIQKFQVEIAQIDYVVISHNHGDHAGGLSNIYKFHPNIKIYTPDKHSNSYIRAFPEAEVYNEAEMTEIDKNVYLSGQFSSYSISEQALFLKTSSNDIILLVGCAHPGLENFIVKSKELGNLKAIIGGFHGFNKFSYLENVEFIGACHCSQYINKINNLFPSQFKKVCVGDTFNF
jgi:7,8-dihydropterin-6-yl-methyl-4-(beta-D-ribofuranosyl)aminobenzene 5'-phosphate synthase